MVKIGPPDRNFAGKVHAFNVGYESVRGLGYEIVGNLDADISFEADYLEFLLRKFTEDEDLGVAGSIFVEEGYSSDRHSFEGHYHVAGGCQLFRKRCFEGIGRFKPNKAGGVDWVAVTTARMMGWKTVLGRSPSFTTGIWEPRPALPLPPCSTTERETTTSVDILSGNFFELPIE
jgi:hypothetical protein